MSEMRDMLADTTERLMGDLAGRDVTARAEAGVWPDALWGALAQAGLTHASAPGEGAADLADQAVIVRTAASHAAPVPLAETLVCVWLLGAAALPIPDGPLTVATHHDATLARTRTGWTIDGTLSMVPWGARADAVGLVVRHEGVPHVAVVSAGDAAVTAGRNLAGEPRDRLVLSGAALAEGRVRPFPEGADALVRRLRLFRLVQMTGALNEALEQAIRYAGERVQFGKPIGKFQAVQQQIAVLASELAASSAAVSAAVAAAERGPAAFEIAAAAVRVCDAVSTGASIAHQVHGAMGVTHEHSLHLSTRRLWSWRDEIGSELDHARAIGEAACRTGGRRLWELMSAPSLEGAPG